jgi:hypothetical protein
VALLVGAARADTPPIKDPSRKVEVISAGRGEDAQPLEGVLRELLARIEVTASFTRAAEIDARDRLSRRTDAGGAIAHVWIDLRRPDGVLLYIADKGLDRVLVRRVPLTHGVDEVVREELAYIVEATVDALLQGGQIGVAVDRTSFAATEARSEPASPPPPRPVPSSPAELPGTSALALAAGYEAQAWASGQELSHGPRVLVELRAGSGDARPGLSLSGQLRFPKTIEGSPIGLRLREEAVRLCITLDVALAHGWAFRWLLGGGADIVHTTPVAFGPQAASTDAPGTAADPVARALAAVVHEFADGKRLAVGAAAEFDLLDTQYYVERGAARDVVLHPWRMRPSVVIELSLDVLSARHGP